MRAAPAQLNLLRGNNCSMDFLLFLYFLFFCFYLFPLSFIFFVFSLSPLICHLPQDLHPSIEYTQRTTQWNKSITHSITGTARPAGSGFWGEAGRKVLWLLEGFSMSTLLAKFSSVSFCSSALQTRRRHTPSI